MFSRVAIARAVAVAADALQLGLFPIFFEGLGSVFDATLDAVVCAVLTWLVGWHLAFLPSFVMEGIPFVDLAPTWTIAVLIATRKKNRAEQASRPIDAPGAGGAAPVVSAVNPASRCPEELNMETDSQKTAKPARPAAEWPQAVMWICVVAITAGSAMYMFRSCVDAPARFVGNVTDRVSNAARDLAAALVTGTVTTQFREYCTEVHPSLSLQVATLKEVEEFTRSDEAVIGNIPLPEVIVSVTAPVEYTYNLDLNTGWHFDLQGDVLLVRVPDLHVNSPSFDVSNMKWEVQKNSLIRNTTRVKEDLRQSLMPLAKSRGRGHIPLVRDTARTQIQTFVEKWVRQRYKDGDKYRVQVYFESEKTPEAPPANSKSR